MAVHRLGRPGANNSLLELLDKIWKEPSPLVNPEIQKGLGIPLNLYSDLLTLGTFGKASFTLTGNPKFKLLFKPIIFNKPVSVK